MITQLININLVTISLSYAARWGKGFETSQAKVYWNGGLVTSLMPSGYNIRFFSASVISVAGMNNLTISGEGTSDKFGLTIDNVCLVQSGRSSNLVVNGGFESPYVGYNRSVIYPGVLGWTSAEI